MWREVLALEGASYIAEALWYQAGLCAGGLVSLGAPYLYQGTASSWGVPHKLCHAISQQQE